MITFDLAEDFAKLDFLFLEKNQIENLSKEVWEKKGTCAKEVRDYLNETCKDSGTIINEQIKLIIVGNGRAGKTSMYRVLKGEPFNSDEKYTHAISLGTLEKKGFSDLHSDMKIPQIKVRAAKVNPLIVRTHAEYKEEEYGECSESKHLDDNKHIYFS